MPEGPECHRTAIKIHSRRAGFRLIDAKIVAGRYKTHGPFPGYDVLQHASKFDGGLQLKATAAWGKLIIWLFDKNIYLHCTLGLKGGWSSKKTKHGGVCLVFSNGKEWFNDQLHYGTLKVCNREETRKKLLSLGPDVCRPETGYSIEYFRSIIDKRANWDISKLLMDQRSMAGVGNYLKSDVLYACGIHPLSICGSLPIDKQVLLHAMVIELSVRHLDHYKSGKRLGKLIYGRKRDRRCNEVLKIKTGDKRNTHYVAALQKIY
jgi:formamidopyrimidine-DNA glycosylase